MKRTRLGFCILRVTSEVLRNRHGAGWILPEQTDSGITAMTQQRAYGTCHMIMVYNQGARPFARGAPPPLGPRHGLDVCKADPVPPP